VRPFFRPHFAQRQVPAGPPPCTLAVAMAEPVERKRIASGTWLVLGLLGLAVLLGILAMIFRMPPPPPVPDAPATMPETPATSTTSPA
jgi:hypothetical protein